MRAKITRIGADVAAVEAATAEDLHLYVSRSGREVCLEAVIPGGQELVVVITARPDEDLGAVLDIQAGLDGASSADAAAAPPPGKALLFPLSRSSS
jgi:ethanolamine utilization microcompartment shell protein EutL